MRSGRGARRFGGGEVAWLMGLVGAVAVIGCASAGAADGPRGEDVREVEASAPGGVIRAALESAGPDAIEALSHVATLSNDFFEGRAPDTRGNQLAAEYIEFHFRRLGLRPAFDGNGGAGHLAAGGGSSFQQEFTVRGGLELIEARLAARGEDGAEVTYQVGADFHPLGFSGNGRVSGPVVFAGYSIEDGPRGYESYAEGDDLTGKVAMVLRYEPLDEEGESRWGRNGDWSRHAGLAEKMRGAQERGASGVILVNPPGVDDARAEFLETHQSTNFSAGVEIPVVQMSPAAADGLIELLCPGCRSLHELRERADEGGRGVVALGRESAGVSMSVELERDHVPTTNVGAVLPGRGALADEYVVIGGHYDHLGYGHFGARDPENAGQIHGGADDNASGIASMLVAARKLKEAYGALPVGVEARSVLFLAFSAEEMGLLGSEHFASATSLESKDVAAMLNLDMVGRVEDRVLMANGVGTSPQWAEMVDRAGAANGLRVKKNKAGIGPSDHTIFYRADIPVLHFFSGTHDDYHTVRDRFETLNYVGCARVAGMVSDLALGLATLGTRLEFTSTGDAGVVRKRGDAKVRLGIMPASYGESEVPGVELGGVFEGTSAGNAGMRKGDRIIRWDGDEIADIGAMMAKLEEHEPGDEVEIVVVRDGEEVALRVVMQARVGDR